MTDCPLCVGQAKPYWRDEERGWDYHRCPRCDLVFGGQNMPLEEQRLRYEHHENTPDQHGYRAFLEPMAAAIAQRCVPGSEGLDYGCGPGPVLALMLGERGMKMALHDPIFAAGQEALQRPYDFITCTEAAEHFRRPAEDFRRLARLLRPGAWLGVMTLLRTPGQDFSTWHYRLDPTHISFYSEATLAWLAREHGWRLERPHERVALFCRAEAS